jgi:putrescine---pyruvate transaminase
VITGFGRMGRWFGAEHYGVTPDITTFAKGVTSGYQPLGGVIVGRAVRDALEADPEFVLRHGYTYSGHPAACAAALVNIDIIEDEGLLAAVVKMGARLETGLRSLEADGAFDRLRGEVAIFGAAMRPDQNAMAVRDRMLELGVVTRAIGTETVTFCPPFVTTDAQVDRIVDALATALR